MRDDFQNSLTIWVLQNGLEGINCNLKPIEITWGKKYMFGFDATVNGNVKFAYNMTFHCSNINDLSFILNGITHRCKKLEMILNHDTIQN